MGHARRHRPPKPVRPVAPPWKTRARSVVAAGARAEPFSVLTDERLGFAARAGRTDERGVGQACASAVRRAVASAQRVVDTTASTRTAAATPRIIHHAGRTAAVKPAVLPPSSAALPPAIAPA